MNWEVWIMKSKTSCFNKTIFKKKYDISYFVGVVQLLSDRFASGRTVV